MTPFVNNVYFKLCMIAYYRAAYKLTHVRFLITLVCTGFRKDLSLCSCIGNHSTFWVPRSYTQILLY